MHQQQLAEGYDSSWKELTSNSPEFTDALHAAVQENVALCEWSGYDWTIEQQLNLCQLHVYRGLERINAFPGQRRPERDDFVGAFADFDCAVAMLERLRDLILAGHLSMSDEQSANIFTFLATSYFMRANCRERSPFVDENAAHSLSLRDIEAAIFIWDLECKFCRSSGRDIRVQVKVCLPVALGRCGNLKELARDLDGAVAAYERALALLTEFKEPPGTELMRMTAAAIGRANVKRIFAEVDGSPAG